MEKMLTVIEPEKVEDHSAFDGSVHKNATRSM